MKMLRLRREVLPILTLVLPPMLLLAACGGDETTGSGTGNSKPSAAATTSSGPTISTPREDFCDKIDRSAVAKLLGIPKGDIKVMLREVAGEKSKDVDGKVAKDESGKAIIADSTLCRLGIPGPQVDVIVGEAKSDFEAGYAKSQDENIRNAEGSTGAKCTKVNDKGFGDPSWGTQCDPPKASGGAFPRSGTLNYIGVFGEAYVSCGVFTKDDLDKLAAATLTFCQDTVAAIAD